MIPSKLIPVQENRLWSLIFCHWIHPSAFMIAASSALFRSCKACRTSMKWWSNRWASQFLDPITPTIWVIICRYIYIYITIYLVAMGAAGRLGVLLSFWCFFCFLLFLCFCLMMGWSGVGWDVNVHVHVHVMLTMLRLSWGGVGWDVNVHVHVTLKLFLGWSSFWDAKNRRARLHAQLHGEVHANILKTTMRLSVPFPFS